MYLLEYPVFLLPNRRAVYLPEYPVFPLLNRRAVCLLEYPAFFAPTRTPEHFLNQKVA